MFRLDCVVGMAVRLRSGSCDPPHTHTHTSPGECTALTSPALASYCSPGLTGPRVASPSRQHGCDPHQARHGRSRTVCTQSVEQLSHKVVHCTGTSATARIRRRPD
ncbi:hypothetical protein RRG08_044049 [Elysia crispata]|uniref:Uncharacterized protein n=1 Tax=Elysia crispata TaxID=231223 RepID=A0AAE1CQX2_9GAST|nr:hypothetical protein RRG08_044049 [Elysia crispata]